jgi:hypothetical protein
MPRRKPPAPTTRLDDLKAASRVIGDTAASRLAWVVRFIGEDPATWHPAVRVVHGDCLDAIALGGVPETVVDRALPDPPAPEEVEALHRDLRTTLRNLLSGNPTRAHRVAIPTEGRSEDLVRLTSAGKKPAMFAVTYGDVHRRTRVFQTVKDLILQAGHQLVACPPPCGKPFIAVRKQLFCTVQCAQRARNERRDSKRPRKTERRRRGGK